MFEVSPVSTQPQPQVAFKAKANAKMYKQIAQTTDTLNKLDDKLSFAQRLKIWFATKICNIGAPSMIDMPKTNQPYHHDNPIADSVANIIFYNILAKPISKTTKSDLEFLKRYNGKGFKPTELTSKKK